MIQGIIYKYTSPSGKCYIGQTYNPKQRAQRHKLDAQNGSNLNFHKAIRKYGWNSFKYEILETLNADTKKELEKLLLDKEVYYIKQYKQGGILLYNMTDGGEGTLGRVMTKEQKEAESKRMLEYYQTKEGKKRLTLYSKPIIQYDLEGNFIKEYPSLCSVKITSDSSLCDYLAGRKHTVANSLWALKEDTVDIIAKGKELYKEFIEKTKHKRFMQKPIYQIDPHTNNIVKKFSDLREAKKLTNICHIGECLRGTRKTAGKYIWIYEDKYNKLIK